MTNPELTADPTIKRALISNLACKIMLLLIMNRIPACSETLTALRLVARLHEVIPDFKEMLGNEEKFIQIAMQELDFLLSQE